VAEQCRSDLKIGQFVPTARGMVSLRTAHTLRCDAVAASAAGMAVVDIAAHVRPGNSIECNRNLAVQRAMNAGCTHLEMLDDDVSLDWGESFLIGALRIIDSFGAVAAAGVVPVHGGRAGKLNVIPPPNGDVLYSAEAVSAAAIVLDLHSLHALCWPRKTPYFAREYNPAMTATTLDEGYFFSRHVRECGGKVVACVAGFLHGPPTGR